MYIFLTHIVEQFFWTFFGILIFLTKDFLINTLRGYTATASINLILENLFTEKGVFPPESVSNNKKIFNFILKYLSKRKVFLNKYI